MTDTQVLIAVIVIAFVIVLFFVALLPLLRRKGVDLNGIIAEAKSVTAALTNMAEVVTPFLSDSKATDVTAKIIAYANVATNRAEQLYKVGELPKDQRNKAARDYVYDTLKLAGVEITPEVERLTAGAIEAAVYTLKPLDKADEEEEPDSA